MPNVDLTGGHAALSAAAETLRVGDAGRFSSINLIAECQLGCLGTATLSGDALTKAQAAVALQINYLIDRGIGTSTAGAGAEITRYVKKERRGRQELEYAEATSVARTATAQAGIDIVAQQMADAVCAEEGSGDWEGLASLRAVR